MNAAELDSKSKSLARKGKKAKSMPVVAFRLDLLKKMISHVEGSEELKIFLGEPVSSKLAVVWDKASGEILLADARITKTENKDDTRLLKLLREAVDESIGE